VEGRKGREREREREANIPHFLIKMNYALSPLLTEETERGIKKIKKNDVAYLFFCWVNWFYFTMDLIY
jgi:hypothetical protein